MVSRLHSLKILDYEKSLFCSRIVETKAHVELLMVETAGLKYRGETAMVHIAFWIPALR